MCESIYETKRVAMRLSDQMTIYIRKLQARETKMAREKDLPAITWLDNTSADIYKKLLRLADVENNQK